ncbi:hypothetical protein [Peterkaempfera sp. SMS 1(5)a]|uniref:hypothetical protein n=1 Tax=Peterkaempfera podocarpi TaxID=3232308 RepID=UPI00366BF4EB
MEENYGPRLTDTMDRALRDIPATSRDLVGGAVRLGRRTRLRRQLAAMGAACSVLTAASLGAVWSAGSGPAHPVAASTVQIPALALSAAQTAAPKGTTALTGKDTVRILKGLLPAGARSSVTYSQDSDPGSTAISTTAGLRVETASGRGLVGVNFQARFGSAKPAGPAHPMTDEEFRRALAKKLHVPENQVTDEMVKKARNGGSAKDSAAAKKVDLSTYYSCAKRGFDGTPVSCSVVNLPDGSLLMTYEERSGAMVNRIADLLRKDGNRIVAMTSNTADAKHLPTTGAQPPLSIDQLKTVVISNQWQQWVTAPAGGTSGR